MDLTIKNLFGVVSKKYDLLNRILSLGQDNIWRRKTILEIKKWYLKKNIDGSIGKARVLDAATGTGDLAIELAKNAFIGNVTAIDLSEEMIELAKKKDIVNIHENVRKINYLCGDVVNLSYPEKSFDIVTVSFGIRNFYDIDLFLKNAYNMLSCHGFIAILEFSLPKDRKIKTRLFKMYLKYVVPSVGKIISGNKEAYQYLNNSIVLFPSGKEFSEKLEKAGFKEIKVKQFFFAPVALYLGFKNEIRKNNL